MLVRQIMSRDIAAVERNATLLDAAVKMKIYDIGMLIVSDSGKPAGLVTDRDLVVRGLAEGVDPTLSTVESLMTKALITCGEEENVDTAAERMRSAQVRRLIVLDARGEPVGVLSLADVAARAGDFDLAGRVVEAQSQPLKVENTRPHEQA